MMASHSDAHAHEHPGPGTYGIIALILTVITIAEVSAYYIPAWEESAIYVPSMLTMSAVKFFLVVAYYMHLKYDHKLFRALFTGPLIVASLTLIGLLFLFSKLVIRLGLLS
jgi:cytochrome c oxidase subunit 4